MATVQAKDPSSEAQDASQEPPPGVGGGLGALMATGWRHHHLLRNFVLRDLRVKYRGTVFGYLWSLLEPLSLVLIYWFVFVVVADRGGPRYPLIVILGVLPYQYLSSIISEGANALTGNAALIRRVYLPRELFVLGSLGSSTVILILSLGVVMPFLLFHGVRPGLSAGWIPLGILGLGAGATGLALLLACANAIYRDVGYVLRVSLRLGFYASPVIYPVEMVPETIRSVYLLNPVAVFLSLIRSGFMNQPPPVPYLYVVFAFAISVASLTLGVRGFRRWQAEAVKFL